MTPQEAINCIDEVLSSDCNYDETLDYQLISYDFDWLEKAKNSLEKQIPKKPLKLEYDFFDFTLVCPECKNRIVNVWNKREYKPNYCHYCGQALDWGVKE